MNKEPNIIVQAKNIHKSFLSPKGPINVLSGVDLSIHKGQSVSIRGESGAGKSTLLNILTLLERPDVGQIAWCDQEVQTFGNSWLAWKRGTFIGLVFQSYYLIPELNALQNVLIGRRLLSRLRDNDYKRAEHLLVEVGLKDRMYHLPNQLSGGEAQRVALARALINHPEIIIADEPTGNLDEKTGESVMQLLMELCRVEGTALLLVTHNPAFAQRTEFQAFLHHGKLELIKN